MWLLETTDEAGSPIDHRGEKGAEGVGTLPRTVGAASEVATGRSVSLACTC